MTSVKLKAFLARSTLTLTVESWSLARKRAPRGGFGRIGNRSTSILRSDNSGIRLQHPTSGLRNAMCSRERAVCVYEPESLSQ